MARSLPQRLSDAVDGWLRTSGASDAQASGGGGFFGGAPHAVRCTVEGDSVVSGSARVARRVPAPLTLTPTLTRTRTLALIRRVPVRPELVPSPRMFFDSDASHAALASLLHAEAAGERAILLMGNQVSY